jgi:hypothetical protein
MTDPNVPHENARALMIDREARRSFQVRRLR